MLNTILSRAQSHVVAMGNPFLMLKMERYMVTTYGESGRCWSHYLRVCLEHDTLTFDPTLKLEPKDHEWCMKTLRARLKKLNVEDTEDHSDFQSINVGM